MCQLIRPTLSVTYIEFAIIEVDVSDLGLLDETPHTDTKRRSYYMHLL